MAGGCRKTQAIIPAAGVGERLNAVVFKALVVLNDKPLLVYALEVLMRCPQIDSIIIAANPQNFSDVDTLIARFHLSKVKSVVAGGETRARSVQNAMAALDEDTAYVLIHDAARPLVDSAVIGRTLAAAYESGAAIAAMPVKPTIKQVDAVTRRITATPDRSTLWEAQTPQVFSRRVLEAAQAAVENAAVTDEATLVERSGTAVTVVEGSYRNLKVTTPEDLVCAAALLNMAGDPGKR